MSPSIQKIEELLFTYLQEQFPKATVTPIHPKKENKLDYDQFILVINYVSDQFEGTSITNAILHPRMSFTIYAIDYPICREKSEKVVDFLDTLPELDFWTDDQKVDVIHRLSRTPIQFDEDSGLFLISMDYRFILSKHHIPHG
jgi:hypothetical protein